ncbi:hypothetical protein JQN58_11995 [Aneurinibacillus sp. BA2021]|nr:hypothetical protein [Aneurinibacillus sp. BA2021]
MDKERQGTPTTLKELEDKRRMEKEPPSTPENNREMKELGERRKEMIQDEP